MVFVLVIEGWKVALGVISRAQKRRVREGRFGGAGLCVGINPGNKVGCTKLEGRDQERIIG